MRFIAQSGTIEIHEVLSNQASQRRCVQFSPHFQNPPKIVYGIIHYDDDSGTPVRVKVKVAHLTNEQVEFEFQTWNNSRVYRIGISWMAVGVAMQHQG